jgi:hypothetical protein
MNAHGITHICLGRVGGKHISEAPNDPLFTEAQLLAGDIANNVDKAEKAARKNDQRAVDLERQHPSPLDLATWRNT